MIVTFNGIPEITKEQRIESLDMYENTLLDATKNMEFRMNIRPATECSPGFATVDVDGEYKEGKVTAELLDLYSFDDFFVSLS